jgi:uroporphyrinogen-III synthase
MQLILTRPAKDAAPLADKLATLGHETILVPLLDIVPRAGVRIPRRNYKAVCITSANGLANEDALQGLYELPLLCVGPQSAAAARVAGFAQVAAHGGDVEGLAKYITEHLRPDAGPLLYLSGAATSGDLQGRLRQAGFTVERVITYDAIEATAGELAKAVTRADAVLLYSPRTAGIWVKQVEKAALQQHMRHMIHLCLSPAVARALPENWPRKIALTPDEKAMFAVVETLERHTEQE